MSVGGNGGGDGDCGDVDGDSCSSDGGYCCDIGNNCGVGSDHGSGCARNDNSYP